MTKTNPSQTFTNQGVRLQSNDSEQYKQDAVDWFFPSNEAYAVQTQLAGENGLVSTKAKEIVLTSTQASFREWKVSLNCFESYHFNTYSQMN